ncbi:MAG: hypothetical protein EPO25_17760 [Gammaproteobacteria bacterium]|nr:MAG: hypothetical protein EPO25_17760 [Gammaproteobacteria bacterium]
MVHLAYRRRPVALPYLLRALWPLPRSGELRPQLSASWSGHRVDPRELAEYLRITSLPPGDTLPLLYPLTFGFRLVMAILTHPTFPVPIFGLLQIRNQIRCHRPIPVTAGMDFATSIAAVRLVARGAEFDLATRVQCGDEPVWESVTTIFARGRFGEAQPPAALTRAPDVRSPVAAEWNLRDADHWRFGRFTGDYNGLHFSDSYARQLGFRRALYHPPRVLAECLGRLPVSAAGPACFDAWIKGPVPHGAKVRLHADTDAGATTFALYAEPGRPALVGRLHSMENQ